jgi:hypothetical protein
MSRLPPRCGDYPVSSATIGRLPMPPFNHFWISEYLPNGEVFLIAQRDGRIYAEASSAEAPRHHLTERGSTFV